MTVIRWAPRLAFWLPLIPLEGSSGASWDLCLWAQDFLLPDLPFSTSDSWAPAPNPGGEAGARPLGDGKVGNPQGRAHTARLLLLQGLQEEETVPKNTLQK